VRVGESYDDNLFVAYCIDHDLRKAFDNELPEIRVNGSPAERESFDAFNACFEFLDQSLCNIEPLLWPPHLQQQVAARSYGAHFGEKLFNGSGLNLTTVESG
jgi:hypothetical protein